METIGRIFRTAREKHGYLIKDIADQTKIGSRYLTALEDDSYTSFPSQTHITGFIRSYAKYLELDPDRMVDIYKRTLVQEAPAPIEELTAPNKQKNGFPVFILIIVLLGALLFAFILITNMQKQQIKLNPEDGNTNTQSIPLDGDHFFALGSSIPFMMDGARKNMVFEDFAPDAITINFEGFRQILRVGQIYPLDLTGDGNIDIQIAISAVSNDRAYGTAKILHKESSPDGTQTGGKTILVADERAEIRLSITARGRATVNAVRDNEEKNTHFLQAGDTVTITANNTMEIRVINPHNLFLNLNNVQLEMDTQNPGAGFVFKWRHNTVDGRYHLESEQLR
ncbi:MAG: helix-turn-helix domain-containing protein [Spirochaetota bacterium]|jgi:transcriptional regulator with XRE-family HTH domain|nr:helix-turn-helix domain-containing protein [Spirochaetota bacterium]